VSVLQDAQEVSFAKALAVAPEELARRGAHLTRAGSFVVHGTPHEIERFLSREPQSARSDLAVD
jgi:hypothetical protein